MRAEGRSGVYLRGRRADITLCYIYSGSTAAQSFGAP